MNQSIIFNNDFALTAENNAVVFSCLVSGLKVMCFIPLAEGITAPLFLQQVKADAFTWEDFAEQAIADDAFNAAGEIWL
ncbi:hypothetical protein GCM10009098_09740 [Rheinheimera aquimaris]|uniref:DUF1488 domain-containing protein n=1 Tax=Rheinheimera aquimaris TaxID=412437 RepID=A0ABN1DI83_9GAMM|nr:DUF1488 family protein [Rheinheimera aquimaris]MCB5212821.1 DUF1488 domain-containing protein [Rheinheimera aquimaris]